jgi:hypothetical protein
VIDKETKPQPDIGKKPIRAVRLRKPEGSLAIGTRGTGPSDGWGTSLGSVALYLGPTASALLNQSHGIILAEDIASLERRAIHLRSRTEHQLFELCRREGSG